ncbi:SUKH-4 family immunity protein [Kitasatospora sp. NPDC059571]|uniref:SUKH-4 family immunity protein n=1 Tax=Kitasatospora sp. NPDC059571 TaxID=3346871 RepID=UPI0036C4993D
MAAETGADTGTGRGADGERAGAPTCRPLLEGALPDRLVHAPTRRLLVEIGLPYGCGAPGLDLATDPAVLLRPLADLIDGPSTGADDLLVLGEVGRDHLVLDGRTGRVALAAAGRRPSTGVLLDPVATDLAAFLAGLAALAALRTGAADPAALQGRRGPAVADEVRAAALGRMRAADPAVFSPSGDAPYWSAAVLLESLRWAARPGAWDATDGEGRLAHGITPDLAAELGPLLPVADADLPAVLRHRPTRRLLTAVGLPSTGLLRGDEERPLATLGERMPWYAEEAADADPDADPVDGAAGPGRVFLGLSVYDCAVLLDGDTGRISVLSDEGDEEWPAPGLSTDLSAYYLTIWVLARLRTEAGRWTGRCAPVQWQVFDQVELLAEEGRRLLADLDPPAFADEESLWNALADDGHMGGLLG